MLFKISIDSLDTLEKVSGFELGHITFEYDGVKWSSTDYDSRGLCMVFLAVNEISDVASSLASNKRSSFSPPSSSFHLNFESKGKNIIAKYPFNKEKICIPRKKFFGNILKSIENCQSIFAKINEDIYVRDDFRLAFEKTKNICETI